VLSKAELQFLKDLKKGCIAKYTNTYIRTLKHRILRKHKQLTYEVLLINDVIDELQCL
jgi:hypothetical protein